MNMNVEILNFQGGPKAAVARPSKVILPNGRPERIIPLFGTIDATAAQRARIRLSCICLDRADAFPAACLSSM